MRYSRPMSTPPKKRKGKFTNLLIVIVILGIAAYFIGAGAAGSWLADNVINPIFNSGSANAATAASSAVKTTQPGISSSPTNSVSPGTSGTRVEEEITAEEISLYALQTGAYSDKANGETAAGNIKSLGGAGYVAYDGGLYKVLVAGYTDESDANDVKTSLKSQGVDATLFNLKSGSLTFKIGAEKEQIDAIKECFDAVPDTVETLQEIIFNADKGQNVDADITSLKEKVSKASDDFSSAVSTDETAVQSIRDYMNTFCETVNGLPSSTSITSMEFSSGLKYALIQIVVDYSAFLSKLNS
jgi:uncharacterized protein YaaQ